MINKKTNYEDTMYKITFKQADDEITLVNTSKKYYQDWEQDVFKHFIFSDLKKWNETVEVITSSPKPFESGNFVQKWKPEDFLQSIGWYHVSLPLFVQNDIDLWDKNLTKQI